MESFLHWPLAGGPGYFGVGVGQQETATGCQHPVWFLSPMVQWGSPCAVPGLGPVLGPVGRMACEVCGTRRGH